MTVASSLAKAGPYVADGMTKEYPFPFKVLDPSHIKVEHEGEIGGYSVRIQEDGTGSVVFAHPVPKGTLVVIRRDVPLTQETDLQNNTAFFPEVLETAVDKVTMICQQLKEELSRCVKVAITSGTTPEELIEMLFGAKDMALNAAAAAADANASCAAAQMTISTIWAEISGNSASAEEALKALKEAFEAAGSVNAAAEAGIASVNEASLAAVDYAKQQISESKDANLNVLTEASGSEMVKLSALINQAVGAEGAVAAAVAAAEKAALDAGMYSSGMQDSIDAANSSFSGMLGTARTAAAEALENAEKAQSSEAKALQAVVNAIAERNLAEAAKIACDSAKADIEQLVEDAEEISQNVANTSITAHNANSKAHQGVLLPLAGGTMQGQISFAGKVGNSLRFTNGNQGVFFRMDGTDLYLMVTAENDPDGTWNSARPFQIRLSDSMLKVNVNMSGEVDDPIAVNAGWVRHRFCRLDQTNTISTHKAFVRNVTNSSLMLCGGTNENTGARLVACGMDDPNLPGVAQIVANDGTNTTALQAFPDGTVKVGGKKWMGFFQNSTFSSSGSNWTILPNGLVMMWGTCYIAAGSIYKTHSFPTPFPTFPQAVVPVLFNDETTAETMPHWKVSGLTRSSFNITANTDQGAEFYWIAIGY